MENEPMRTGEVPNRRYWGGSPKTEFGQALKVVALNKGIESQIELNRRLVGDKYLIVGHWISDKRIPSPECFGALLRILKPNDEQLDMLARHWVHGVAVTRKRGKGKRLENSDWS